MAGEKEEPPVPEHIDKENDKYTRYCIDEKGEVHIEAFNFNGDGCRQATERIENRLGIVKDRKDKNDGSGGAQQTVRIR